jgi:DNA-binding GntR family transcriptional regulator
VSAQMLDKLESVGLLPERIADNLREAIIRGTYQPGERLTEAAIADQLGVSTIPVREAFHLLEREGLMSSVPRRGKFVRAFAERHTADSDRVCDALDNVAYAMIREQGGLSASAQQQLQQDIDALPAAMESGDLFQASEMDLQFHDHIYAATGSEVLQDMWAALRTRLFVLYHWRFAVDTGDPIADTIRLHKAILSDLLKHCEDGVL